MSHIRVQVGELVSKYGVGEQAGAKGLPEDLGLVFGHDVLAVVARDQHHDMAGALAAAVATMDFARFAQGCHTGVALEVGGAPIIIFSTWLSTPRSGAVSRPNRLGRRRVQRFGPPGSIGGVKAGMLCRGMDISVLLIPKHQ
ncbi:hypothetical protein D3C80_905090 [compost metagenome]